LPLLHFVSLEPLPFLYPVIYRFLSIDLHFGLMSTLFSLYSHHIYADLLTFACKECDNTDNYSLLQSCFLI
jgi:hypothetical protein